MNKFKISEPLFVAQLKNIGEIPDWYRHNAFIFLLSVAEGNGWFKKHFLTFLETIYEFTDEYMYEVFCNLIDKVKGTELMKENYSQIKTHFLGLWNYIDKLCICKEDEEKVNAFLQEERYWVVIEGVDCEGEYEEEYYEDEYYCDMYHQQDAYSILIEAIKCTKLENEIFSKIKNNEKKF